MCTIGVMRLGGDDYLLFKNKDFVRSDFDDRLTIESDLFGAQGVVTWAGTDPDNDVFSGMSIGANAAGLLCADSNVRTVPDHSNYDDLVEIALREGDDVPSAVAAVEDAVATRPYLWANLLLIDGREAASVEVKSSHAEVVPLDGRSARANHHVVLGANEEDDDTVTSVRRFESAQRRIQSAKTIEDIFALQRSHDDGDTGVCNHSLYQTVYSYVLRRHGDEASLHILKGHPCSRPIPEALTLPIGKNWSVSAEGRFRAVYPSSRSLQMG